jgi:hypothetical protein
MTEKQRLFTSILLVLAALVSISAATVAWFTIADRTRLRSMNMEITSGNSLRFDLDAHEAFEDYLKTLTMDQIAERILKEKGFDLRTTPLEPVTTTDQVHFTLEDGTLVEDISGAYLEYTLHFMASQDMVVHLTSQNSEDNADGTKILSDTDGLVSSMRISFTAGDETYIYSEGRNIETPADENRLFSLKEGIDQPVQIRIWLEGTDEHCTDELRGADYSLRLRFIGTDDENQVLESTDENP